MIHYWELQSVQTVIYLQYQQRWAEHNNLIIWMRYSVHSYCDYRNTPQLLLVNKSDIKIRDCYFVFITTNERRHNSTLNWSHWNNPVRTCQNWTISKDPNPLKCACSHICWKLHYLRPELLICFVLMLVDWTCHKLCTDNIVCKSKL